MKMMTISLSDKGEIGFIANAMTLEEGMLIIMALARNEGVVKPEAPKEIENEPNRDA